MYSSEERYASYKRAVLYVTVYSAFLFATTPAEFLKIKTVLYFLSAFSICGAAAVVFMSMQHKIEMTLNPKLWIINILIDVVGYYLYTRAFFTYSSVDQFELAGHKEQ